jgi:hypothetical protein
MKKTTGPGTSRQDKKKDRKAERKLSILMYVDGSIT